MTKSHKYIALWAILFWTAVDVSMPAWAENHALLIGIGKYRQRTLEGPPYDVAALYQVLANRYNFPRENIQALVNEEAGRSRILSAIERLTHRTRPGDRVFIYFSGHGTSRRDEVLALPLPHTTGALVPADFDADPDLPVERLLTQLIIGKRDLRPALAQLDRDRQVLMIFDTCFSGNTVRATGSRNSTSPGRYLPLHSKSVFKAEQQIGSFEENLHLNAPYPYQNIFYISAASENEVAKDIQKNDLHAYPTIDGNPHGVLTDALLRVLAGRIRVDTDSDGRWSQIEIYEAVKNEVRRRFPQSPQALPRVSDRAQRLHSRTFFVQATGGANAASAAASGRTPGRTAANYQPVYSSSHALIVGINEYRHWPRLEYAADDAREMAGRLKAHGFQICLLTDDQATLKNMLAGLETIRRAVDENSRVVFYFAGHGRTEDLPGERERGYIVPVDADACNWQLTMLPMDRLNRIIKQFEAKHILMAFDSCYSGLGLVRSIKGDTSRDSAYIRKMMQSRSIQILTAGSRSEQAAEAAGHGLFTDHLLAALAGAADINSDGYITATEIYATVRPAITRESYSRQTPQFGYIEGNGDMIFSSNFPQPESAAIMIETAVSGVDVWAGTANIGRRLPAGRHRLPAPAGRTILIVKKGARTLYRYNGLLSANRVFPIRIMSPAPTPSPEPFAKVTIVNHNVDNYSNSVAHDLDGDGREEIVTATGSRLYVFRIDGTIVWERKFAFPISLNLIEDWDSQPAIGLSGMDNDKIHLMLLNQRGEKIWQHVRKRTRLHTGRPDGSGSIAGLADIDRDGRREVIAFAAAEHTRMLRGIIVYDRQARELWRYSIGPTPQSMFIWPKDAGRPDIIIGTYSIANGNRELENSTSDMQTYIISIDGFGKTNWQIPAGEFYTGVVVLPADQKRRGRRFFFAHTYTSPLYREDVGAIYKISRAGQILNRFETQNSILSAAVAESDQRQREYLYAADNRGNLLKLDDSLNLLQKKSSPAGPTSSQIRLVGVHDYDGDGRKDLLMYSFKRLLGDRNPLAETSPTETGFWSDLKFEVVAQDFSRILQSVTIADAWEQRGGFAVKDLARPEAACYPFMALADKISLFNY